jgi:pentatricopeptide repeat protein
MRLDLALVNAIIHSYAQIGEYRAADNFFRLMPTLHLKPDLVTFHSIMLAFANSKEATKAHDVLRQMRSQVCRLLIGSFAPS